MRGRTMTRARRQGGAGGLSLSPFLSPSLAPSGPGPVQRVEPEQRVESESEQNQKQMLGPVDVHRRQTVAAMGMIARAASRRRSGTAQLRVASPRRSMI